MCTTRRTYQTCRYQHGRERCVFLEKINGEYQGASFAFRSGFRSGVLRMAWARDGSLFIGETNRGWGSAGDADLKAMLTSYTCLSCHNPDRKLVGPSFRDISKRKYTPDKIVQLIHNPQPQNWPDYPTPMPPMPQVKREDAFRIAAYINSIR